MLAALVGRVDTVPLRSDEAYVVLPDLKRPGFR